MANNDDTFDKLKGPWMEELSDDEWWDAFYAWRKAERAQFLANEPNSQEEEKPC